MFDRCPIGFQWILNRWAGAESSAGHVHFDGHGGWHWTCKFRRALRHADFVGHSGMRWAYIFRRAGVGRVVAFVVAPAPPVFATVEAHTNRICACSVLWFLGSFCRKCACFIYLYAFLWSQTPMYGTRSCRTLSKLKRIQMYCTRIQL